MNAKNYWESTDPATRYKFVKGLHPLSYFSEYKDLLKKEKAIVKKYVKSLEE